MKPLFKVYHWDTFDNESIFLKSFQTLEKAEQYVAEKYDGRIRPNGADRVDIVQEGKIILQFNVG